MDPRHTHHPLQRPLSPTQLRLVTAFKAALAAVIAIGLAMGLGWTNPYWAGISVMVVTLPYMGAALEKSLMRVAGTIIAGILAYLITGAFAQEQAAYVACLFVILIVCGYYGSGTWYPYAFTLCGLTLMIVATNTMGDPGKLWIEVFFRISEISLGVMVALMVNAIFWPQNAGRILCVKLGQELDACSKLLSQALDLYQQDKPFPNDPHEQERAITNNLATLRPLLQQALKDNSHIAHHRAHYQRIFESLENFFITLTILRHAVEIRFPRSYREEFSVELQALREVILRTITDLSASFKNGVAPAGTCAEIHAVADAMDAKINTTREAGINLNYPIEDTSHFYAIVANLMDLARGLEEMNAILTEVYSAGRASVPTTPAKTIARPAPRLDKRRFTHGIKVAIACVGSLYAWLWLQWPGGAQAVITCTLVMQATMVASNQKAILRLGGCLLGGTCGAIVLIFLEPLCSSYWSFSIPLFFVILLFGWINFGNPAYSYAGFQAYIAFLLMTSIGNTQNISMIDGVHRFMGILLGVLISMLVQRLFWPVIPEKELKRDFAQFFSEAAGFLKTYTPERLQGQPATKALSLLHGKINASAASAETWLSQIAIDRKQETQRDTIRRFALAAQTVSYRLRALEQAYGDEMPPALRDRLAPDILAVNAACASVFEQIAEAFSQGSTSRLSTRAIEDAIGGMTRTLTVIFRKEQAGRPFPGQQVATLLRLARRYRALATETNACCKLAAEIDFRVLDRSPFF